jgi:hypothetical protein
MVGTDGAAGSESAAAQGAIPSDSETMETGVGVVGARLVLAVEFVGCSKCE